MKHLNDAHNLIKEGKGLEALAIIDNLLELAPKNPTALRLKAKIFDAWGYFDRSLAIIKHIAFIEGNYSEGQDELEEMLREEREALIFSELSSEGRWYFSFPRSQVWVSVIGFFGCAVFLMISSNWLDTAEENFTKLLVSFFLLVLIPWIALMIVHFSGIKKILVGIEGIKVHSKLKEELFSWNNIKTAVIEYDPNLNANHLQLLIYGDIKLAKPILTLNISQKDTVVRARKHFVRSILTHLDTVIYRSKYSSFSEDLQNLKTVDTVKPQEFTETGDESNKAA